jgi:hypothetical protein
LPSSCRKFTVFLEPMFRNIFSAQIPRYIGSCNFFSNLHVMASLGRLDNNTTFFFV